jgi:uridine kinase
MILSAPRSLEREVGACCLAGFPAMGKSTMAAALVSGSSDGRVVALNTESYIRPWEERERLGTSGCSPRAYDLAECAGQVRALLCGTAVDVPVYSRATRACTGKTRRVLLPPRGLLILDGSCSCLPEVVLPGFRVFFFVPQHRQAWLDFAIGRDRTERGYGDKGASEANRAKERDCVELYEASRRLVTTTVVVAAVPGTSARRLRYSPLTGASWLGTVES